MGKKEVSTHYLITAATSEHGEGRAGPQDLKEEVRPDHPIQKPIHASRKAARRASCPEGLGGGDPAVS